VDVAAVYITQKVAD